jgi:hypothetical protein
MKNTRLKMKLCFLARPFRLRWHLEALKHTGAKDKLAFTAFQSGESKPFSASGLHDALKISPGRIVSINPEGFSHKSF